MKLFAVLFLTVYSFHCIFADVASDVKEVNTSFNESKKEVESKFDEIVDSAKKQYDSFIDFIHDKSEGAQETLGNYKECGVIAAKEMKEAVEEVIEKMKAKKEALEADLKKQRDEAVTSIEEGAKKSSNWWSWVKSSFDWIRQKFSDGFAYLVGRANEFKEFKKELDKEAAEIQDRFNECVNKKE